MGKKNNSNPESHPKRNNLLATVPLWLKVTIFRWWVVGTTYFFLVFEKTKNPESYFSQVILLGAVIGLLNSLCVSYVIDQLSHVEYHNNPYISLRKKGTIGTLSNIVLSIFIVFLIGLSYDGINRFVIFAFSLDKDNLHLPAEPIGFALIYLGYDFIWRYLTFRKRRRQNT